MTFHSEIKSMSTASYITTEYEDHCITESLNEMKRLINGNKFYLLSDSRINKYMNLLKLLRDEQTQALLFEVIECECEACKAFKNEN